MLTETEQKFVDFAGTFRTGEPDFDRNINLKLAHTLRVEALARRIAEAEGGRDEGRKRVVVRAALLHDLSRFEQFRRYRTFNDAESFDHGDRSARLIDELGFADDLSRQEHDAVVVAVRLHNKVAVPSGLPPEQDFPARIVRDADKIDIMPILIDHLKQPDNEAIVYGLRRTSELTPAVAAVLERHESPRYAELKTVADFVAAKLVWVYDLNFQASKAIYRERRYLEQLLPFLPDGETVRRLYRDASAWVAGSGSPPEEA